MLWVLTSLIASLGFTAIYLIANHILEDTSTVEFSLIYSILATLLYLPLFGFFLTQYQLNFNPLLIALTLVSGLGNTFALLSSSQAINLGEVSTVTPLVKTQPIFTATLGFLILSESMNLVKVAGISVVTAGAYVILLEKDQNLLQPIKSAFHSLPAKLAVLTAIIYSIASISDRFVTQQISPYLYTFFIFVTMSTSLSTYYFIRKNQSTKNLVTEFKSSKKAYLSVGVSAVTAYLAVFYSFSLAPASKVVPLLQLQVLITVIGGIIFFNEKGAVRKAMGSLLLIAGVILII